MKARKNYQKYIILPKIMAQKEANNQVNKSTLTNRCLRSQKASNLFVMKPNRWVTINNRALTFTPLKFANHKAIIPMQLISKYKRFKGCQI